MTKTLPELKKTEKVLSALAKGIPIIDFKYVKKIVSASNINKWNEEEYDIGGKHLYDLPLAFTCHIINKDYLRILF